MKNVALFLSAVIALAALACGSPDPQPAGPAEVAKPAAAATATVATQPSAVPALPMAAQQPSPTPTPTARPEPTAQPTPTITPLPAPSPTVQPTSTALPSPTPGFPKATPRPDQLPAAAWDLILGPAKKVPSELNPGSPVLPPEKVVELWDKFLRGTRMLSAVISNLTAGTHNEAANLNFAFCDDGTGRLLINDGAIDFSYTWSLRQDRAGRWHNVVVDFTITRNDLPVGPRPGPGGSGLLFVSEDGPHYYDPLTTVTFAELLKCPV